MLAGPHAVVAVHRRKDAMIEVMPDVLSPRPLDRVRTGLQRVGTAIRSVTIGDRVLWPVWAALNLALLGFVINARSILPAKFFYDAGHIQTIAQEGLAAGKGDQSFIAVGELYNILGLADSLLLTNIVSWLALAVIHAVALRRLRGQNGTVVAALPMLAVSMALGCVFLTSYSKDAVILAIASVALFAAPGLLGEIAIFSSLALYAALFRNYWVLVVVMFAALRIADRLVPRRWMLLLVPPIALVLLALAHQFATGLPIDNARALANAGRIGSPDAASLIPTYVDLPAPVGSALNAPVTWLSLLVPLPLVVQGSAYYALVGALIIAIWALAVFSMLRRSPRRPLDRIAMRSVLLAFAYAAVQAVFEPDYGSALRHLSPLLVLIAFAVGRAVSRAPAFGPLLAPAGRHRARTTGPR